jgi:pantoate--beta-alanine ligase
MAVPGDRPLVLATPELVRDTVGGWRRAGASVGLVPTMGALHAGHLSLVTRAAAENDRTVVSIFVNPLQFGPAEDFGRYPRDLTGDLGKLAGRGVDAVYSPATERMYPEDSTTRVRVGGLSDVLEGAHRPGHFDGVATVVTKLFSTVRPDRAYFGQKDAQQAALVTRLARDLDLGVEIVVCPIVRDEDGLALSSRNVYLSTQERESALALSRSLRAANDAYLNGEREPANLRRAMRAVLDAEAGLDLDYAETVDPFDFRSPGHLALVAARVGKTRLIDNHRLGEPFPD